MAVIGATGSLGGFAGGNALARLLVVFSGDTSSLDAALARSQGTLQGFGANAANIGKALTRAVTLPILAVGGASLFMAAQFESALGRIEGLTPIVDQIGGGIETVRTRLLALAQVVPTTPNDLAESLYFAGSAGLNASQAFEVVELSAKGAAIGMGEAADISKVLIAALNAYEDSGLTATVAMDALTAAVREGTAEPAEMAIALGRLIPVAQQAGVTFQETVGALAALTNIGLPARVATTSLRALFAELLAPTQQASERLLTLGLSAEKVRDVLATVGPVGAFKLIEDAVRGDDDALRDILPQIRGFTAYLGIAEGRLDKSAHIMDETTNSAGRLEKAFEIISQTPSFKFQIGLNKLRVAAIKLGGTLFPVFEKLSQVISDVGDRLANMPKGLQVATVAFGLLAAAAGPVLQLLGNMGAFIAGPISGFKALSINAIAAGIAVLVLVASFQSLMEGSRSLFSVLTTVVAGTLAVFSAMRLLQGIVNLGALGTNALTLAFASLSTSGIALVAVGLGALIAVIGLAIGASKQLQNAVDQTGESFKTAVEGVGSLRSALQGIEDVEIRERLMGIARAMDILGDSAKQALPDLQVGIGAEFTKDLEAMQKSLQEAFGGRADLSSLEGLQQMVPVLANAAANGQDLGAALKTAGFSAEQFFDAIDQAELSPFLKAEAGDLRTLSLEYGEISQTLREYQQSQVDSIHITEAGREALSGYAQELGVTTDYLASRLNEFGISAAGMSDTVKQEFEAAAFGVDENGKKISARVAAMEAAIDVASQKMSESLVDGFAGFEKAEDTVKGTTQKLLATFQQNTRDIVDEVGNIGRLVERGVPTDLLQFLVDQGPGMIAKFVGASDKELRKLTVAYQTQLAATDTAILDEATHQKAKGAYMVQQFTTGILGNSQLPPQAASRIVNEMTAAFAAGHVSEAGLHQALAFANGLSTVKNLTQQQAVKAMDAFIAGIGRRDLANIGRQQAQELARGISQATNIPLRAAQQLVNRTIAAVQEKKQEAQTAGGDTANQYAAGLRSAAVKAQTEGKGIGTKAVSGMNQARGPAATAGKGVSAAFANAVDDNLSIAYNAGVRMGDAARRGFIDGARDSPKFFSYYLGIELVKQLEEGIKHGGKVMGARPAFQFPVTMNQGRLADEGGGRRKKNGVNLDLDVRMDRTKAARALDWEYSVRGK